MSALSPGSDGKNFRIYVRHELVVALINESPLQLDPEDWLMPALEASPSDDQLAMHMMWLAGKSINLTFGGESGTTREGLTRNLRSWYDLCPPTFRGTEYGDCGEEGLQKVFFAVPAAGKDIWGTLLLHRLTTLQQQQYSGTTCLAFSSTRNTAKTAQWKPKWYAMTSKDLLNCELISRLGTRSCESDIRDLQFRSARLCALLCDHATLHR